MGDACHTQDLCQSCRLPGRCCTGFTLNHDSVNGPAHEHVRRGLRNAVTGLGPGGNAWVQVVPCEAGADEPVDHIIRHSAVMSAHPLHENSSHILFGLPFEPLWQFRAYTHQVLWKLWCRNLQRDGRCGDYENRPALCRVFKAGTDPLCIEYAPPETQGDGMPKVAAGTE